MGKTRRAFTVSEKLRVVEWHMTNGGVVKKTAREFDLNPKHVRDWLASHSVLLQNDFGSTRNKLRLYSGNRAAWPQLDQEVFQFFTERRSASLKISDDDLKEHALRRAKELDLQTFTASNGWLRRWKLRHGVRVRRGAKRTLPVEKEEQLTAFFDAVQSLRAEHGYSEEAILLMHQLTVRFTSPFPLHGCDHGDEHSGGRPDGSGGHHCHGDQGTSTAGHTYSFTVSLAVKGNGLKYPATVVFKTVAGGDEEVSHESELLHWQSGVTHIRQSPNVEAFTSNHGGLTPQILECIIDQLSHTNTSAAPPPKPVPRYHSTIVTDTTAGHVATATTGLATSPSSSSSSSSSTAAAARCPVPMANMAVLSSQSLASPQMPNLPRLIHTCSSNGTDSSSPLSVDSSGSPSVRTTTTGSSTSNPTPSPSPSSASVQQQRPHRQQHRHHHQQQHQQLPLHRRQLLIVDSSRDHTTVSCRRAANRSHFDMVVIPDGCLSVLDRTVHTIVLKPFKEALHRHWHAALYGHPPPSSSAAPGPHTDASFASNSRSPSNASAVTASPRRDSLTPLSTTTQNTPAPSLSNLHSAPAATITMDTGGLEPVAKAAYPSMFLSPAFSPSKSVSSSSLSRHDNAGDDGSESDSSVLSTEALVDAHDLESDDGDRDDDDDGGDVTHNSRRISDTHPTRPRRAASTSSGGRRKYHPAHSKERCAAACEPSSTGAFSPSGTSHACTAAVGSNVQSPVQSVHHQHRLQTTTTTTTTHSSCDIATATHASGQSSSAVARHPQPTAGVLAQQTGHAASAHHLPHSSSSSSSSSRSTEAANPRSHRQQQPPKKTVRRSSPQSAVSEVEGTIPSTPPRPYLQHSVESILHPEHGHSRASPGHHGRHGRHDELSSYCPPSPGTAATAHAMVTHNLAVLASQRVTSTSTTATAAAHTPISAGGGSHTGGGAQMVVIMPSPMPLILSPTTNAAATLHGRPSPPIISSQHLQQQQQQQQQQQHPWQRVHTSLPLQQQRSTVQPDFMTSSSRHQTSTTPQSPLRLPSMQTVCDVIGLALDDISPQHIREAFRSCGLIADTQLPPPAPSPSPLYPANTISCHGNIPTVMMMSPMATVGGDGSGPGAFPAQLMLGSSGGNAPVGLPSPASQSDGVYPLHQHPHHHYQHQTSLANHHYLSSVPVAASPESSGSPMTSLTSHHSAASTLAADGSGGLHYATAGCQGNNRHFSLAFSSDVLDDATMSSWM